MYSSGSLLNYGRRRKWRRSWKRLRMCEIEMQLAFTLSVVVGCDYQTVFMEEPKALTIHNHASF